MASEPTYHRRTQTCITGEFQTVCGKYIPHLAGDLVKWTWEGVTCRKCLKKKPDGGNETDD